LPGQVGLVQRVGHSPGRVGHLVEQRTPSLGAVTVDRDPQHRAGAGTDHHEIVELQATVSEDRFQQRAQRSDIHVRSSDWVELLCRPA
jgi:hypothetical protein